MSEVTPATINRLQAGVPPALALLAGMQLDVFTAVGENPRTAAEIAGKLGVSEERLLRLLHALVLTGLLELADGRFSNSAEAATFLVKGKSAYIGAAHELISDLWQADLHTAASIRNGTPAALHDFAGMTDDALSAFLRGLQPYASAMGHALAENFDFSDCASVIDIGGGSGATLSALLKYHPGMGGTLFELSRVAQVAVPLISDMPCSDRIDVEIGDIVIGAPTGLHDAAILRAVVQVLSPTDAARAVGHACRCLRPGGTIYITGSGIIEDDRLGPAAGVYLNLTLMNLYPGGTAYTHSEHFAWLLQAGCDAPRHVTLPGGAEMIWATKAAA